MRAFAVEVLWVRNRSASCGQWILQ